MSSSEKTSQSKVEKSSTGKAAARSLSSTIFVSANSDGSKSSTTKPKTAAPPRIKSYDFRGWDKYDVDEELKKVEQEQTLNEPVTTPAIINKPVKNVPEIPSNLSSAQKIAFSENEKNKGNDCMRAKEYESALEYYSNSLRLHRTTAVLNNRALAYLKLEKYSESIEDSTSSLAMETSFKALLRRSTAYYHIGKYQNAIMDVDLALEQTPINSEALALRKKIMDKWSDVDGTITETTRPPQGNNGYESSAAVERAFAKKLKIVEIEEEEEEKESVAVPAPVKIVEEKKAKKVVIVDVDEDSSDEDQ